MVELLAFLLRQVARSAEPLILQAVLGRGADLELFGVNNKSRLLGFLSVVLEETGGLRTVTEGLAYSAEQAHKVFPHHFPSIADALPFAFKEREFANKVYGGRMGNVDPDDGWRYRGRGLIQITGRDNYTLLQNLTGLPLIDNPDAAIAPDNLLRTSLQLFNRFPDILNYCDAEHWHAVWALVGSGRSNGVIINLPAHEDKLAALQAAFAAFAKQSGPVAKAGDDPAPSMPGVAQNPPAPAGISQGALDLIKRFNPYEFAARLDEAGVPAIGYGLNAYASGAPVALGQTISKMDADGELQLACERLLEEVGRFVDLPGLGQNQRDALISLCHDLGPAALFGSRLLENIMQNYWQGAADEFLVWNKPQVQDSNVPPSNVMTARRQAERDLFLSGAPAGQIVPISLSNQERVVRGVGFRDAQRKANVLALYDANDAVIEIVEMGTGAPGALSSALMSYPSLKDFRFAAADETMPEGERVLYLGATPASPALETPKLNRTLLVKGLRDSAGDGNIAQMQSRLRDLGYFKGEATGFFGPVTDQAVKAFQAEQFGRPEADGLVGPRTWAKLFGDAPPLQPVPAPVAQPVPAPPQAPVDPAAKPAAAPAGGTYLYLTRSGARDTFGGEALNLAYVRDGQIVDRLAVCSGSPRKQVFRTGPQSPSGSFEPLPEGLWSISDIAWCDGEDNYSGKIFNDGTGPAKIELGYQGPGHTARVGIEMHIDWNRARSPGTAGCVGLMNIGDFKRLVTWLRDTNPRVLRVDWGLGTLPAG